MNENPFKNRPTQRQEQLPAIEIAQVSDWELYKKIRLEALQDSPEAFDSSPKDFLEESQKPDQQWKDTILSQTEFVLLIKVGSEAKGMVIATQRRDEKYPNWWRIRSVYVTPQLRRTGISRKMLEQVIEEIRRRGGVKIALNVNKDKKQEAAFKLYERLGFKQAKRRFEFQYDFSYMELELV